MQVRYADTAPITIYPVKEIYNLIRVKTYTLESELRRGICHRKQPVCPVKIRPYHAGKTRLAKYYIPLEDSGKRQMEYDVHRAIASRDPKHTNFVEVKA